MPYKNPEDKRKWEREHREQRKTQRINLRFATQSASSWCVGVPKSRFDHISDQKPKSTWGIVKQIGGFALGVGILLLGAWGGTRRPRF